MISERNGLKPTSKGSQLEQRISVLILVILLFIGLGILYKQSRYDLKKYGLTPERENAPEHTESEGKINTDTIAPAGFSPHAAPSIYNSQTLYEKINGKAPLYLSSGFRKLLTMRYMHGIDNKLWMEIYFYDMGSPGNAFSVYSRQIRADASFREDILYSYTTGNSEIMVRDKYYIEIIGSKVDPVVKNAVSEAAANIRAQIGPMHEIPELLLLKDPDLVKGSEKYYIKGAFGFEGFENVYSARYRLKEENVTAFISGPFSREKIDSAISEYRMFLINEGSRDETHNSSIHDLIILDFDGYFETMFRVGEYMAGVHEADTKEQALELSEKISRIIKRNSGEHNR